MFLRSFLYLRTFDIHFHCVVGKYDVDYMKRGGGESEDCELKFISRSNNLLLT